MRKNEITQAIIDKLQEVIPVVRWSSRFEGANRGNSVEGTVTCDRIEYSYDSKNDVLATASYTIFIIDTNSTQSVDDAAATVFSTLNNDDLEGLIIVGDITEVIFGSAKGMQNSGIVALTYRVQYYEWR